LVGALVGGVLERVAVLVGRGAAAPSRIGHLPLGDVRAGVERVGHAVFVVVGVGAAVRVFETVHVLRLIGTLVGLADDTVLVAVGAAVGLRIRAALAGLVRARILLIGDAVLVVVGVGAAVGVLEAVGVLFLGRAAVVGVTDSVVVVVPVGAAVGILEAVPVLGELGTLIDVVWDAIVVDVVHVRRPPERRHDLKRWTAERLAERRLGAEQEPNVRRREPGREARRNRRNGRLLTSILRRLRRWNDPRPVHLGDPREAPLVVPTERLGAERDRRTPRHLVAERSLEDVALFEAHPEARRPLDRDRDELVLGEEPQLTRARSFAEIRSGVAGRRRVAEQGREPESTERTVRNDIALSIKCEIAERLRRRQSAGNRTRRRVVVARLVEDDREVEAEREPLAEPEVRCEIGGELLIDELRYDGAARIAQHVGPICVREPRRAAVHERPGRRRRLEVERSHRIDRRREPSRAHLWKVGMRGKHERNDHGEQGGAREQTEHAR
jgi:hypothetical protein